MNFAQPTAPVWTRSVIYGKAGSGKTSLAITAPAPLVLSIEAGLLSLRGAQPPVPALEITNTFDFDDAFAFVTGSPEAARFQTIYVDSLTELAELFLEEAIPKHKDPRQAYAEMQGAIWAILKSFRALQGKHVVFTARQIRREDAEGIVTYGPEMPGRNLAAKLSHLFDELLHLDVGPANPDGTPPERRLRTGADYVYDCKDRSGKLALFEFPNLSALFEKIGAP